MGGGGGVISLTTILQQEGLLGLFFCFLCLCVCLYVRRGWGNVLIKYSGKLKFILLPISFQSGIAVFL